MQGVTCSNRKFNWAYLYQVITICLLESLVRCFFLKWWFSSTKGRDGEGHLLQMSHAGSIATTKNHLKIFIFQLICSFWLAKNCCMWKPWRKRAKKVLKVSCSNFCDFIRFLKSIMFLHIINSWSMFWTHPKFVIGVSFSLVFLLRSCYCSGSQKYFATAIVPVVH